MLNSLTAAAMLLELLVLCVLPYVLAVAMPSWRWLLGCSVIVGGSLAAIWIQDCAAHQSAQFKEGPGYAIGVALISFVSIGFAAGVLSRVLSLFARAYGWSFKSERIINFAGFLVLLAVCGAPFALLAFAHNR
jgi:hypothetical protein